MAIIFPSLSLICLCILINGWFSKIAVPESALLFVAFELNMACSVDHSVAHANSSFGLELVSWRQKVWMFVFF